MLEVQHMYLTPLIPPSILSRGLRGSRGRLLMAALRTGFQLITSANLPEARRSTRWRSQRRCSGGCFTHVSGWGGVIIEAGEKPRPRARGERLCLSGVETEPGSRFQAHNRAKGRTKGTGALWVVHKDLAVNAADVEPAPRGPGPCARSERRRSGPETLQVRPGAAAL